MSALVEPDSFGSVLVVGGCGFVGFHIVRHLLQDSSCTAIAVLSRNPNRNLLPGVSYHTGDIEDVESIQHPSVLASVYTSTSSVVAGSEHVFVDESHPVRDSTIKANDYSKTKGLVDALVLRANKPESIDGTYLRTLCIRPAGIYGGRGIQTMRNILISKQKGKSRVQLGDNSNLMDWVSVDNVASARPLAAKALLAGINNPSSPKVDGEAFVITDGAPYHSGILKSLGRSPTQQIEHACLTKTYCIDKARNKLGYVPAGDMDEAIRKAVAWALEEMDGGRENKKRA